MLFLIDLDDAYQRLSFNLRIVVEDHVKLLVNRADALSKHLFEIFEPVLRQLDVLTGRDAAFLQNLLSVAFEQDLVRVGKRAILPFLLN